MIAITVNRWSRVGKSHYRDPPVKVTGIASTCAHIWWDVRGFVICRCRKKLIWK